MAFSMPELTLTSEMVAWFFAQQARYLHKEAFVNRSVPAKMDSLLMCIQT